MVKFSGRWVGLWVGGLAGDGRIGGGGFCCAKSVVGGPACEWVPMGWQWVGWQRQWIGVWDALGGGSYVLILVGFFFFFWVIVAATIFLVVVFFFFFFNL